MTTKTTTTVKKPVAPKASTTSVKKTPVATAKPAVSKKADGDQIALFIDLDNTGASLKNVQEVISNLKTKGTISNGFLYGYTDDRVADFEELVREYKFETSGKLRLKSGESTIDLRLVMDVISFCEKNKPDAVFVWLGQGDLLPLFQKLKDLKIKTLTVNIEGFDCKNKFVDEAITLWSPYVANSGRLVPGNPTRATQNNLIDMNGIPVLPRNANAPAFGADSGMNDDLDNADPMSPEEYKHYRLGTMLNVMDSNARKLARGSMNKSDDEDDIGGITRLIDTEAERRIKDATNGEDSGDDFGKLNK
ncbi:MAG: NYN domain-containing protein [Christensenellaceae bacterium]|jgi:hypothetical protein|nr:NYN domain-containing protein [Christensenellaceae bacterium]